MGVVQNIVNQAPNSSSGQTQSIQPYSSAAQANVQMGSQSGHPSQTEHSIEYAGSRILQEAAG